jgi:protein-tyrosine kinase
MSRIYEALKKAEKERKKKTTQLVELSPGKAVDEEKIEDKQKAAWTEILKAEEEVVEGQVNDLLVTLRDPLSQSADQFMKVCVRMVQNGQDRKRVLITSPLPQEGKTMATANLAIGLARLPDTHVTLIDADLRKPELHKVLGASVDKGLNEYLEDGADFSEIYYDTSIPRLFIIPGGKAYSQPERILSSDKLQRLLKELQAKHPKGYIVIDSPPILLSTEFEILLNHTDSVIMVVRYGKTPRDNLRRALDVFDKRKVTGIIFNQIDQGLLINRFISAKGYYRSR